MSSVVLSLLFGAMACYVLLASSRLPVTPGIDVGPALFPRIIAVALLLLSAAHLITSLRQGLPEFRLRSSAPPGLWKAFVAFGIMAAYPVLLDGVGFTAATVILAGSLSALSGARSLGAVAVIALGTAIMTQLLFQVGLKMPLPVGRWVR